MHDKPITTALYLLFGLLLTLGPIVAELCPSFMGEKEAPVADVPAAGRWRLWGLGCVLGGLLGLSLAWWHQISAQLTLLDMAEAAAYVLVMAACLHLLAHETNTTGAGRAPSPARWVFLGLTTAFVLASAFGTGMMEGPSYLATGWHHWGAYVAPAELMRDGARIFYDFPAQYGLGPTVLLATACGGDCWSSLRDWIGIVTVGLAAAMLLPLFAMRFRTSGALAVALLAVAAATLLWTTGPAEAAAPTVYPSTGGMRFLPPAALAAVMWWRETSGTTAKSWTAAGFVLFGIGVLWSPESLFMTLAVWGPYYCLRRMAAAEAGARAAALFWALVHIALAILLAIAGFVGVYEALFGILPKLHAYLVYMLFPPGPLPINWRGPVWFCIVGLALGAWNGWRLYRSEGNTGAFRRNLLLLMLAYGSLCYALGRSHDNNFVNLLPYFALLLVGVLASRQGMCICGAAAGMLSSLVALLILFNWSAWSNARVDFSGQRLVQHISFSNPDSRKILAEEGGLHVDTLLTALDRVRKLSPDPVEVIDSKYLNLPGERTWTALHGAANYVYMPDDYRALFVQHTAERFHRKGWLIIDSGMIPAWVGDFLPAYQIDQNLDFGDYHALHLTPKPLAAAHR